MMQLNGKTYYRIAEAVKELGYTKGTLSNYISSGVCEAERMEDGEWLITESGMVALRRRKKLLPNLSKDEELQDSKEEMQDTSINSQPKKQEKRSHHPENFKEGCLYLRNDDDHQKYTLLKQAAEITGLTVGDMSMVAVRHYVNTVLTGKIEELKKIETQKKQILAGII